jgi:eukaryotic-like serine/threonine-protein kinase
VPLRILIIDDHRDFRAWLGHHLAAAYPDALVVGHEPSFDNPLPPGFDPAQWGLVFLDYRLGDRDGLEVLGELKGHPSCPPIVFLTPQGDQRAIVRAIEGGADDYLCKGNSSHEHIGRIVREAIRRGRQAPRRRTEHAAADDAAFVLKGHRFLKSIGTGSTASVYLMEQLRGERLVVAKVFRQAPGLPDPQAAMERFMREYEVVSGIRHENVVRIFELGIADDMAYIVMEYFSGGHLGERIGSGLPMNESLEYLSQVARALEAIHEVGVLHRDLKPANITFREDGSLALIDFGVAKLRDAATELTGRGEIFGTPYYMSPEQGDGIPVDERSDFYSLGVVLHEMLTGRKPYVAASPMAVIWKHRHAPLPRLPENVAPYQPLLERMMAKRPEDRYPSARALLDAIGSLQGKP